MEAASLPSKSNVLSRRGSGHEAATAGRSRGYRETRKARGGAAPFSSMSDPGGSTGVRALGGGSHGLVDASYSRDLLPSDTDEADPNLRRCRLSARGQPLAQIMPRTTAAMKPNDRSAASTLIRIPSSIVASPFFDRPRPAGSASASLVRRRRREHRCDECRMPSEKVAALQRSFSKFLALGRHNLPLTERRYTAAVAPNGPLFHSIAVAWCGGLKLYVIQPLRA